MRRSKLPRDSASDIRIRASFDKGLEGIERAITALYELKNEGVLTTRNVEVLRYELRKSSSKLIRASDKHFLGR